MGRQPLSTWGTKYGLPCASGVHDFEVCANDNLCLFSLAKERDRGADSFRQFSQIGITSANRLGSVSTAASKPTTVRVGRDNIICGFNGHIYYKESSHSRRWFEHIEV